MKLRNTLILFLLVSLISGCWPTDFNQSFPEGEVLGYSPVYASEVNLEVSWSEPQELSIPGQIYLIDTLILLVEENKGIHVIGNSDPTNPQKVGFFNIQGASQLAIKDGVLYTNQFSDVIAVDLKDVQNPRIISRDTDVLSGAIIGQSVPPIRNTYFTCPDSELGRVIGWEEKMINSPKCYR